MRPVANSLTAAVSEVASNSTEDDEPSSASASHSVSTVSLPVSRPIGTELLAIVPFRFNPQPRLHSPMPPQPRV